MSITVTTGAAAAVAVVVVKVVVLAVIVVIVMVIIIIILSALPPAVQPLSVTYQNTEATCNAIYYCREIHLAPFTLSQSEIQFSFADRFACSFNRRDLYVVVRTHRELVIQNIQWNSFRGITPLSVEWQIDEHMRSSAALIIYRNMILN